MPADPNDTYETVELIDIEVASFVVLVDQTRGVPTAVVRDGILGVSFIYVLSD